MNISKRASLLLVHCLTAQKLAVLWVAVVVAAVPW